ncbi:hypothetical protein [Caballeronia sp. INML1]|uniref:hypothetical protein n=1 Tax=Caballeronia sp. INML1 TaxID=2921760 RepID=UPI0020289B4F|nr:hypothetical protein [Caballeronia sp. INML1]
MALFQSELGTHHCRKCEHCGGEVASGHYAVCVRGPGDRVVAMPTNGCSFWTRAIGADDAEPQEKRKSR